ncbi:MAG: 23S rRNA (guanosine(2251)-2'-O)-methyltransferase RlmB [Saprospiraceae bacterium]|nr:23S rRNA (guanosine(2251)-2'-O)-methyltransferase RlmB [Saprospiraceae bacterium]
MQKKDLILGKNALKEAIAAQTAIQKIFISESLDSEDSKSLLKLARSHKIPVLRVPKSKLDHLSRQNHQGVIALINPVTYHLVSNLVDGLFMNGIDPALVICDGITDVRNFGAIARSAEVFGIHGIVIGQKNSAPINSESIKSSSGALLSIPVCREKSLVFSIRQLQASGIVIVGASEKADQAIADLDLQKPLAFVFGSEGSGISDEIRPLINEWACIPQSGNIQSLNVSVAAGIFFYEWKQHQPGNKIK